ncbi:MAG: serine/threonine protein kinase, partial [Treponemataceae bacterium]
VYGLQTEDDFRVIAKFYRPGRWSEAAIREELSFVAECAELGLPVLTPLHDAQGETLQAIAVETPADASGDDERLYFFSVYPFVRGRGWEPVKDDDWLELGRLIASLHEIGARKTAMNRLVIGPETSTRPALQSLLATGVVHPDVRAEFEELCVSSLERLAPLFDGIPRIRLHGDLHRGNLLDAGTFLGDEQPTRPILIDFDDTANGPAVQDFWLFLPGRLDDSRKELGLMLEGYEEIRAFDRSTTALIEPLRLMRMIAYLDWQARQRADAGFDRAFPDWGGRAFWIKELEDLRDQARVIEDAAGSFYPA